ncbi:PEP-CTERM protein-sorting domain-containing protein [Nitrosomonas marina]|uniref:PEP-CTERM protein-sorting domain-containing protein n=1 Tax=Nitrosomonas marina TaxID=917 RepID=A0A1I0EHJ4_9PROT|nr:PEP-CTERM sorting domain-containing protein [Nitrosomonas marina]SET44071.1 PEP-CTERM protein-sorting domain-containing protein [Nitrosomonas marina]
MKKIEALISAVFGVILLLPIPSNAIPVIDQSQTVNGGGTNNITYVNRLAQTFTVGMSGLFTGIDILAQGLGSDPDITVSIQSLDTNGFPDDSNILGSSTLSGPSLITSSPTDWHFDFLASNIVVNAGDQLALVLSSTDDPWSTGDVSVVFWGPHSSLGDFYTGGGYFATWDQNTGQDCGWCSAGGRDMYFRTYVDQDLSIVSVPEPTTMMLFGIGFAGLLRYKMYHIKEA